MFRPSSILRMNGTHLLIKRHLKKKKPCCDSCLQHIKGLLKHYQFASIF